MGAVCCCLCRSIEDGETDQEMEMQAKKRAKSLAISAKMSAPTIAIDAPYISGNGLALIGVAIEQDAAYWEWHIKLPPRTHVETILFGVAQKKDRKFYQELEDKIQPEEGERDRSERTIVDRKFKAGL
jgi:hypothetical protein